MKQNKYYRLIMKYTFTIKRFGDINLNTIYCKLDQT